MADYYLTTDHSASSYGMPVLVDPSTGTAYGPADKLPDDVTSAPSAWDYVWRKQDAGRYAWLDEVSNNTEASNMAAKFLAIK
jgi:hypothetical protein